MRKFGVGVEPRVDVVGGKEGFEFRISVDIGITAKYARGCHGNGGYGHGELGRAGLRGIIQVGSRNQELAYRGVVPVLVV